MSYQQEVVIFGALCSGGRHDMPPPRASGDLNSHPELSAWRSLRMSMMKLFVFHCLRVQWPLRSSRMSVMWVIVFRS